MDAVHGVALWLHWVAAVLAIGGVAFLRLILMPVVRRDGCEHAPALSDKVRAKFRKLIWHSIGLLTITGGVMLWLLVRVEEPALDAVDPTLRAMVSPLVPRSSGWERLSETSRGLLVAKIGLALMLFAVALTLTIPREPSERLRRRAPALLILNLMLGAAILLLVALRHVYG
jgi:hypothetical protein